MPPATALNLYPCQNVAPDGNCPLTPTYQARECVSYAAYMASRVLGRIFPTGWGNAWTWPSFARALGWTVDSTPEAGSIMALGPNVNGAGKVGHVAWVEDVGTGYVSVSEYDFLVRFGYDEREFPTAGALFIHLPKPPPIHKGKRPMFIVAGPGNAGIYFLYPDGTLIPIGKPNTVANAKAAGIPEFALDPADTEAWNAMQAKSNRVNGAPS
jgi:surface antigen